VRVLHRHHWSFVSPVYQFCCLPSVLHKRGTMSAIMRKDSNHANRFSICLTHEVHRGSACEAGAGTGGAVRWCRAGGKGVRGQLKGGGSHLPLSTVRQATSHPAVAQVGGSCRCEFVGSEVWELRVGV